MSIWTDIEGFFTNIVEPDIKALLHGLVASEVAAIKPIATSLLMNVQTDLVTAAATGKLSSVGAVLGSLVAQTAQAAEAASITAGAQSLLGGIAAALTASPVSQSGTSGAAIPVSPSPTPAPAP